VVTCERLCLAVLAVITAINLRGIAHSARTLIVPTVLFVGCILLVILIGLLRSQPAVTEHAATGGMQVETVGGAALDQ
jgi:amino acid transporter